jgi:hypothetical protein
MSARRLDSEGHRPGLARLALIRTFRRASHPVFELRSGGLDAADTFPGDAVETDVACHARPQRRSKC